MAEKSARLELRVTVELLARIEAARGDVSRTRWVERALERALGVDDCVPERAAPAPERRSIYVPGVGSVPDDGGGRRVAAQVEAARNDPVLERQFFAGLPESQQPSGGRLPAEEAKRSAPRLAVRQGKGVFTPRPKGKS